VQFETEEPVHRVFASLGYIGKGLVLGDAPIVTDGQRGRVDETDTGAASEAVVQIGTQGQQSTRNELYEATVAAQLGEFCSQMLLHILCVVSLEIPIPSLVEVDEDRHDLAFAQRASALAVAVALSTVEQGLVMVVGIQQPEIIDMAEQFR
jgi:hypothetical protein